MTLFRININKIFIAALLFSACTKDDQPATKLDDGKSTVINDLAGDTRASISDGVDGKEKRPFYTFLYSFKDKKQIWIRNQADSAQWLNTDKWDIAFTGNYNSDIYINNGTIIGSPGYKNSINNTAILFVDQPYNIVNTAPSDGEFNQSTIRMVGMADSKNTHGWYAYNLTSHIMKAFPDKTYVLRLSDGKYAKLQILSAYKGNPPGVTDMYWPAPYLSFRFYVQQDGSKNLNTK
ncbi:MULTISPECIES: HmuY family protein [unclassified Sphingobacterium]|uniref:HmuY family protein n=1 Tax=unclassified Sphingobacterium TaxID=2609468 RepID=UPI001052A9E6|nr:MULTISPECIES: HmuY family protein [unclassified Sphingobacterium]MCS3552870.1 hypothetical protein [Sphingobacterium sp. JUb21]TCR10375.1 heme-binding HmuY-like protein [Sphingobacterium sp. JUb20]